MLIIFGGFVNELAVVQREPTVLLAAASRDVSDITDWCGTELGLVAELEFIEALEESRDPLRHL